MRRSVLIVSTLVPCLALLAALAASSPAQAAPAPAPTPIDVVRAVSVEVPDTGDPTLWRGRIAFGTVVTGTADRRVTRPADLQLDLSRTICDVAGCIRTILSSPEIPTPVHAKIANGLSSAGMGPVQVAIRVRRVIDDVVVSDRVITLTLHVSARRTGSVTTETRTWLDGRASRVTVTTSTAMRAQVVLADETLPASQAHTAVVRTVVGGAP
jgi:hypothetical protein